MTGPGVCPPRLVVRQAREEELFGAREAAMKGLKDLGLSLEGQ